MPIRSMTCFAQVRGQLNGGVRFFPSLLMLNLERAATEIFALNRQLVGGYIQSFRAAAAEFGLAAEPDLNVILRIPGAMDAASVPSDGDDLGNAVLEKIEEALARLNEMRE